MPVFNERTTVETIIRRVLAVPLRIELIVVDDGSTDGSGEILEELQKTLTFTLFRQPNAGKGAALRRGFAARHRRSGRSSRMPISSTRRRSIRI